MVTEDARGHSCIKQTVYLNCTFVSLLYIDNFDDLTESALINVFNEFSKMPTTTKWKTHKSLLNKGHEKKNKGRIHQILQNERIPQSLISFPPPHVKVW